MDIYSKRIRQTEGRELQYEDLPRELKVQIIYIWQDLTARFPVINASLGTMRGPIFFFASIHRTLCKEYGVFRLTDEPVGEYDKEVENFFLTERDAARCLDVIELVFSSVVNWVNPERRERFHG